MNCRRFQNRLFEYLDGSLSARAQAAAEAHLAACPACRETARQHQQLADSISTQLRKATQSIELPPEVRRRVLAAASKTCSTHYRDRLAGLFWRRLGWFFALATAVVLGTLLASRIISPEQFSLRHEAQLPKAQAAREVAWIEGSYVVPTYSFRDEGGRVVDALTLQTNLVTEVLWVDQGR